MSETQAIAAQAATSRRGLWLALVAGITIAAVVAAGWWLRLGKLAPPRLDAAALAATITPEQAAITLAAEPLGAGHWSFAARDGTPFTAAGIEEIRRAIRTLAPATAQPRARALLRLPPSALRLSASDWATLPNDVALTIWWEGRALDLTRRLNGPPLLKLADRIDVAGSDLPAVEAVAFHLNRPLQRAHVRVIALAPGGPLSLPHVPRIDPATKEVIVDAIEPSALAAAMGMLRGSLALVLGRPSADGATLGVRTDKGATSSVDLTAVNKSASEADAGLIVLEAANAVQPGGRNWYWRTIGVPGLPSGTAAPTFGDALVAMLGGHALVITPELRDDRLNLRVTRTESGGLFDPATWRRALTTTTAGMLGEANVTAARLSLPAPERQRELDRRWFKRLPAAVHLAIGLVALAGLTGAPTAWRWWARIWPAEQPGEYAGRFGYQAARGVRALVFALVFLPLVALAAGPAQLARWTRRMRTA